MDIFGNFSKLKGDREKRRVQRKAELDFSYSEIMLEPVSEVSEKAETKKSFLLKTVIVFIFGILVFRLFSLQVAQGEANQKLAEGNRIRPRVIEATRGIITDKNGVWLARNKPSYSLSLYPSDLPKKKADRFALYQKLSDLTGLEVEAIKKESEKNGLTSLDEIEILENIGHEQSLVLEEKIFGLPGVFIAKKPIREYKILPGLSHLLGYTGIISPEDKKKNPSLRSSYKIGKTGLEVEYENFLRGVDGVELVEVNSNRSVVRVLADDQNKNPVSGNELVLNIDAELQQKTADALNAGIAAGKEFTGHDVYGGVAAVMDVHTGAVLSMVSLPDYDNNLFASKISSADYQKLISDPKYPMFNRAIQGVYPPGSVSKIIMAAAGLTEGTITSKTSLVTPYEIKIGEWSFPDWKDHSYENTDIERAIAESNNIFFYALGGGFDKIKGIGIDKIKKYWQFFGLGRRTGIDLLGEASGFLPDQEWKKRVKNEDWYLGDTYHVAIGQGDLLVTPIQMLRATAVIANGGKLLEPQLAKAIVDPEGKIIKEFGPVVEAKDFLSQDTIDTVARGMRMTVTEGSARNLSDLPVSVAGKTGTAQFLNNQKTHAWFECYAPYENPQIAIIVMVEGGGGGHEIAAPVAKEILSYYFGGR